NTIQVQSQNKSQRSATRVIRSNLETLWSGPWDSWRDVPTEDRTRLFERFQMYFQWEKKHNASIYRCWENCIAGKIPNLLRGLRNAAINTAIQKHLLEEDEEDIDMSILIDFKPAWIKSEIWKQMLDNWNTPEWKAKSLRNKEIRRKATGGKHTLGYQTYVTAQRKAVKYNGYVVEKYGNERREHPKFDDDLWYRASGGMNKGKVYGLGNVRDSYVHDKEDPE
ncbi:hypothetical protein M8C21_006930, partial [Ambrosia artemisiifolia]